MFLIIQDMVSVCSKKRVCVVPSIGITTYEKGDKYLTCLQQRFPNVDSPSRSHNRRDPSRLLVRTVFFSEGCHCTPVTSMVWPCKRG